MRTQTGIRSKLWLFLALSFSLPAASSGDTLKLADGSTLKGRVVSFANDTLVFRAAFGADVRVPRERIVWIDLTDSLSAGPVPAMPAPTTSAADVDSGATGELGVTFKDGKLSSKIKVTKRQDEDGHLRANGIMQLLLVDGDTAFVMVDTTMEKTIYQGPDRVYKNDVELEDIYLRLPPGPHNVSLVIRNVGANDYRDRFENEPLDMEFVIGDVIIYANRSARVNVGISRGKLRLGSPRLYRVD